MHRARMVPIVIGSVLAATACGEPTDSLQELTLNSSWLAGSASAKVGPDGLFRLALAPSGELAASQAVALASAFVRDYGYWFQSAWSEESKQTVNYEELEICGRAYYARSSYEAAPPTASSLVRAAVGPRWLVTMCASGQAQVSIAVSAVPNELTIEDGHLRGQVGNQILAIGVPPGAGAVPITPEEAARATHEATGMRLVEVPELVLPPYPYAPQLAKWRIELEEPIGVHGRASRTSRTTKVVYFGPGETWFWRGLQGDDPRNPHAAKIREIRAFGGRDIPLRVREGDATTFEPLAVEVR